MKTSNEVATTKQTALAAISNLNAINAEQTLSLLQGKLQRNAEGKVVIIDGGVEQDLNAYLTSLKNPGSGWEHQFKPRSAAYVSFGSSCDLSLSSDNCGFLKSALSSNDILQSSART